MTEIFLLIKRTVDYDDFPMSEKVLHAFTTEEKLETYKKRVKIEDEPYTGHNRTIFVTKKVELF